MLSCACPVWAGARSLHGYLRSWASGARIVRTSLSMTGLWRMDRRGGGETGGARWRQGPTDFSAAAWAAWAAARSLRAPGLFLAAVLAGGPGFRARLRARYPP